MTVHQGAATFAGRGSVSANSRWTFTKNIVTDYGAVGDGSTNNDTAFTNYRTFALANNAITDSHILIIPASANSYVTTYSAAGSAWWRGIRNLTIQATGAIIGSFNAGGSFPQTLQAGYIQTASVGSTTLTFLNGTELSNAALVVGDCIAVASLEFMNQDNYPPNLWNIEYHDVVSIVGNVVTIAEKLHFHHPSTWPLTQPITSYVVGGPACVFKMDDGWNMNLTLIGGYYQANNGLGGSGVQLQLIARNVTASNLTFTQEVNISNGQRITYINCNFNAGIDLDKCMEVVRLFKCNFPSTNMHLQSASTVQLLIDGCSTINGIQTLPRDIRISNSTISSLQLGTNFGQNHTLEVKDSVISAVSPSAINGYAGLDPYSTYANGTFTIANGGAGIDLIWAGVIPGHVGMVRYDPCPFGAFPFRITNYRQDVTNTYVDTDLTLPTLPLLNGTDHWEVGLMHPCANFTMRNCTGSQDALSLSQATAQTQYASYQNYTYSGDIQCNTIEAQQWGRLVSLKINVTVPYAGSTLGSLGIQFGIRFVNTSDNTTHLWSTFIDLKVAGLRTITTSSATGIAAGDWYGITFPTFALPTADWVFTGTWKPEIPSCASIGADAGPTVNFEFITDQQRTIDSSTPVRGFR